jgi:tRNA (adenine57-N1/adenine58-N1)-methyltransferase
LVEVAHRDVCGKDSNGGGFQLEGKMAHAVMLDLPEPWLAVPHAAFVLKRGGRIASYSPCVEQAQRCISAMQERRFHSIRTLEFRLMEHYVDEVELWPPPREKRPRLEVNETQQLAYAKKGEEEDVSARESTSSINDSEQVGEDQSSTPMERDSQGEAKTKRGTTICARPFPTMRGHTAFLTFATAGNTIQSE